MRKIVVFVGVVLLLGVGFGFAEEITLTTYYPAPFGVYDKMETDTLKITGGSPGAGKVLTSDADGLASWQSGGGLPAGSIIMYSGAWSFDLTGLGTGDLQGWALANGNNSTPDLTDRFIMATNSFSELNDLGGSNSYSLTVAQLPAHSHTGTTNSAGVHSHTIEIRLNSGSSSLTRKSGTGTRRTVNTNASGAHSHTFTTNTTGGGAIIDNRPAFIQLAFIMKQ